MKVSFYFDPCCPFCWITSRWLVMVCEQRDLQVAWQPFSLMLKNGDQDATSDMAKTHQAAHRVNRVMLAANQQHSTSLIDLYSSFGSANHLDKHKFNNDLIRRIIELYHLPAELLAAADDHALDNDLQKIIDEAVAVAGDDIGVPTIVFAADDGSKSGFFGPVLQSMPSVKDGLQLWDSLSQLASDKNFYELKRSRPAGGPDVASTAEQ
ncbi:MAG: DsbA family protein [Candidatus Saccharimonadales bacterium]